MTLKDKINSDILSALKSGLSDTVLTLRFLISVIKSKELEKRTKLSKSGKSVEDLEKLSELSDEEIVSVILGEIKKRKESITQYGAGGREDLAEKETKELEIIKNYAPEEIQENELRSMVKRKIGEMDSVSTKEFGKIMGSVMADVKGRASGDAVKKIIEDELKQRCHGA